MKVLVKGDFSSAGDYGYTARAYCEALLSMGTDVLYEEFEQKGPRIALGKFWKEQLEKNKERTERASVKIWNETPNTFSPSPAMKNVALVPWDVSTIPSYGTGRDNWVQQLNKMDLVWTPTTYAKEAMFRSGVVTKIEVIPYPVNTNIYKKKEGGEELLDSGRLPLHEGWFKFLSVFPYMHKADPASLLLAYLSEFKPGEETALVLRTFSYNSGSLDGIKKFIAKFKKDLRLKHQPPRVFLVPGTLTDEEMADLMNRCHCAVTTARAEGTARRELEAMACGLPVIAPNGSAFLDHVTAENGYPVQVEEEPVNGMSAESWYYATQIWHRIDVMDLRRKMREAYEQRSALENKSSAAIDSVRTVSTGTVGRKMQESLETLLGSNGS